MSHTRQGVGVGDGQAGHLNRGVTPLYLSLLGPEFGWFLLWVQILALVLSISVSPPFGGAI